MAEEGEGLGASVLAAVDFTPERIRGELAKLEAKEPAGEKPVATPRLKKVLELSLREALSLGHNYIGTEHVLLGLVRLPECTGSEMLTEAGVDADMIRNRVIAELSSQRRRRKAGRKPSEEKSGSPDDDAADEAIEAVPTHRDRPATTDELGRARLAEILGERIRRVRGEDTETAVTSWLERRRKLAADVENARDDGSFIVHVHAPWGAGKSSLLNFLALDLRNRKREHARRGRARSRLGHLADVLLRWRRPANPNLSQWVVVEFSAWEHQRLVAPWWWLLSAVQRACSHELWRIHRGRWLWFWVRDVGWRIWNARAAVITVLLLGSLLGLGWLLDWFGLAGESLTTLRAVLLTVTAAVTLAVTVFGLARGTSKWLAIGSADGAVRFLRRAHDPLGVYRKRFRWLVRSSGRPIIVFIDDLDRCKPSYVVELLEGIQTLFTAQPVVYVVAADRQWVCESFAKTYSEFETSVGTPGRPLGFLFLEKTFQISFEIPPMSRDDRNRYWANLMRVTNDGSQGATTSGRDVGKVFANVSTQADVEKRVDELSGQGVDKEQVLQAAVRRLNAPDMQEQLEGLLAEFAPLLDNNPRSMKRLMNAYGIERDRLLRDGHLLNRKQRRQLALLTILRLRWPLFADHLRRCPGDARFCRNGSRAPSEHPYRQLFDDPEVCSLFDGSEIAERLDPSLLEEFPSRPASERSR